MLKDIAPKARPTATRNARTLRRKLSLPEVILWRWLRRGDRPQLDAGRDEWLRSAGIETLRIPAADVLNDADAVLRFVVSEARNRLPLHHPTGGPPPRGKLGED